MRERSSKFGIGMILGAITGFFTGILFAPKSGKQTRRDIRRLFHEKKVDEKVKEIFGEVSSRTKEVFEKAREELVERLAQMREAVEQIDKQKYIKAVEETATVVRDRFETETDKLERLKRYLLSQWSKLNSGKKEEKSS